jgi:hypothetical protein
MGLIQLRLFVREGLCTLVYHCTGANEHVACSACTPFIKEVFYALCKVYEVCTVVEQNFYVPRHLSSFINMHDVSLVRDPR